MTESAVDTLLACLLLPAGAIGDRYGRRSALLVGVATFAAASAAPLVFDSPIEIIAARHRQTE